MNIGASILIGQSIEDLRREGIQTPPTPAAKALTSSDGVAACERRMNEAKKRCEDAYWMTRPWRRVEELIEEYAEAKREYEAAKAATDPSSATKASREETP